MTIEWRHASGALVNGTLKVNASIAPVTVAGFSTLDDPTTAWTGQTKTPPTIDGNEFLTILGSGPVNVTAGIGTIFVHADNVPGTAILSVTGVDPDTQQPLSNQIAITIAGAASPKLPGAVTVTQASGGVYVSGANGAQSKVVSAQVLDGNGALSISNVLAATQPGGPLNARSRQVLTYTTVDGSSVYLRVVTDVRFINGNWFPAAGGGGVGAVASTISVPFAPGSTAGTGAGKGHGRSRRQQC